MNKKTFWHFFFFTQLYLVLNEPYNFNKFIPVPGIYATTILYVLFLVFLNTKKRYSRSLPSKVNIAFVITAFVWLMYGVLYSDASYFTRIVFLFITYLFLNIAYLNNCFERFWLFSNRFILLQTFLSVVCFVLIGIGLLKPLAVHTVDDGFRIQNFYFWGGCFSKTYIGNMIRPSGYLDEPGALAAWAVYGLMLNYAFIKDKYIDKYLPWFTISTLSVAYFIQMGGFLVLRYIKKVYKLIPIVFLLTLSILYINTTKGTDFDIYSKTIARFEYNKESGIAGNSRQIAMENSEKIFKENPWFGIGGQNFGRLDLKLSDNPYEILAKDGIIGFTVTYLPLIIVLFSNRRKEVLICTIIIAIGYLQRPFHINYIHDLYLWSFMLFCLIDKEKQKK